MDRRRPSTDVVVPNRALLRSIFYCLGLWVFPALFSLFLNSPSIADDSNAEEKRKAIRRAEQTAAVQAKSVGMPYAVPTLAAGDLYALVVGVGSYKHPEVPKLALADKDATDFAAFLNSQGHLFRQAHIRVLTNEAATKFEIEKMLYHDLKKAGKSDTIIMFFSGHGTVDPSQPGEFFFLSHDSHPDYLAASGVNMSGLKFMKALDCPRVLLIADACNAGGFSRVGTKAAVSPFKTFMREFTSSSGRVILTSSRPEEYSLEKPNLSNSVFTHYLLDGLRGAADKDSNGVVTFDEAYRYVYDRTKEESRGAQHPQFEGTVEGTFPIALSGKMEARAVTTLELTTSEPAADVFVGDSLVGRTDERGSLFLKYLPLDVPIPVRVAKAGWKEKELGPFVFTRENNRLTATEIKLDPARASLELETVPGGASVTVEGKSVGRTGNDGRISIRDLQVAVPLRVELEKQGYRKEVLSLIIPEAFEAKTYRHTRIELPRETAVAKKQSSGDVNNVPAASTTKSVPSSSFSGADFGGGSSGSGKTDSPALRYMNMDHR